MEPENRFQGMNSASLCSLVRYNNPIPPRFLAPIDCLKIPALLSYSQQRMKGKKIAFVNYILPGQWKRGLALEPPNSESSLQYTLLLCCLPLKERSRHKIGSDWQAKNYR
jgi:hypothetical protein